MGLFGQNCQSMPCWGSNRSDSRGRSSRAIKFGGFCLEHLFPIFLALFATFWLLFAKQLVSSFLPLSRQTNDNFGNFFFKFPKASPYYRGKKLVEFDLDLLEITQISNFCNFLAISLQNSPFFFLPSSSLSSIER